MIPATRGRIAGAILAAALGSVVAVSALAEPKKVTELKGSKLYLYSEAGRRVGWEKSVNILISGRLINFHQPSAASIFAAHQ